jgi:N-acetylneuraminic acid mutarotase
VAVTCSTELARDMQPANDRQTGLVDVQVHDVGCARVTAPRGVVDLDSLVAPACTVRNYGSVTETYVVRMRIGSAYSQPVAVTGHAPGTDQYVTFPAWTAGPVGTVAVTCSTELSTDPMPANDRLSDSVRVRAGEDVGVVSIDAPSGRLDTSTVVVPRATVRNFGQLPARCDVFFRVRTGAGDIYTSTRTVTALAPDSSATVLFDTLAKPHLPGAYATRCSSGMAGDANPANDVRSDSFRFTAPPRTPGWTARTAMPGLPSGKPAKDGGWLTYDAATGLIYAAKGNKTTDFYSYNPRTDSWRQLAPIPMGTEAKPPSKGAVGCASGTGVIFATKGNNTSGFYKYVAARDSWYALTGVPLGVSGKKVKGGTDLAYIDAGSGAGHVYCLKGYNNEFYRYNSPADSWSALATAPAARYDKGSWLAHVPAAEARVLGTGSETDDRGPLAEAVDAGGSVYCHQAKYHGFGAFNLATQTWSSGLTGMPFIGRSGRSKKSKDGGAAAVLGSAIYAFKGGGTQEFWHYLPGPGTWSELETLPQVAPGGASKKKVKAGADLTASLFDVSLYGLKGNKTLELWRYVPALAAVPELAGAKQGVMSVAEPEMSGALRVSPNPLVSDRALVRLGSALARRPGGLISASVIDAAGRCVLSASVDAERPSFALDLESLHAGVYLLRIEAGDRVLTQKLVIQR